MQPSSPARLYNVQNDAVHFHTGHLENKHQILMGVQFPEIVLVEFDTQGDYVRNVARDIPKQFLSVVNSRQQRLSG